MIHLNQAVSLALIYTYRATNGTTTMIDSLKTIEYEHIINKNLKEMKSKINSLTPDYQINKDELFFSYQEDINGNGYYVLMSDKESIEKRKKYIMTLPLDVVISSQKQNALEVINLELVDDKIIKKENEFSKQLIV